VTLDPWNQEPTGAEHAYMLRKCGPAGISYGKGEINGGRPFPWPEAGYVECNNWERDGGLWGCLHGQGNWSLAESRYESGVYQICTVALSEARYCQDNYVRVPRLWVTFTGSEDEVADFLRNEGDTYSREVCMNFQIGINEGRQSAAVWGFLRGCFWGRPRRPI
jgi:hypothetical protein